MKSFHFFSIVFAMVFTECTSHNEKKISGDNILIFAPAVIESEILTGAVQSECNLEKQQLYLNIKLKNSSATDIIIENINIETPEGYQAKIIGNDIKPSLLNAGAGTMMTLQFKPVNDFELYMLTGESGKFKQLYNLSMSYTNNENKSPGLLKIQLTVSEKDFAAYKKNYKQKVTGYKFDTHNNFAEEQKNYLQPLLKTLPFVYSSSQEIAIAGLNFRLQSYRRDDSIHAQLFIVNHADFAVKINPAALDIFTGNSSGNDTQGKIEFKKVTGLQEETDMLRKGDRAMIKFTKYLKDTNAKGLSISLKNVFLLQGGNSLFYENPKLTEL